MNHDPFSWGRPSDEYYGTYNNSISRVSTYPAMNTQQPIVTGTSVISIKYKNGIVIAADKLGAYGSLLRFTDVERLITIGDNIVVGVSGDISDMQYIEYLLEELKTENNYDNLYSKNEESLQPSYVFEYLATVLYQRRSKMNPLWNAIIVAGIENNKPFLKYVNLLGITYSSPTLATGFGSHLALPLLRKVVDCESDVEQTDLATAKSVILESMKVLYYRDARSARKFSLVVIDNEKGLISDNLQVENMVWGFAKDIRGYGTQKV